MELEEEEDEDEEVNYAQTVRRSEFQTSRQFSQNATLARGSHDASFCELDII